MKTVDQGIVCYIGVGSNLGEPDVNCLDATTRMEALKGVDVLRRSSLYRTEPVGDTGGDWFVNAVVEVRTVAQPKGLLEILQGIEHAMGRVRDRRWGPRVIDLDILFYGQHILTEEALTIPHPELHRRAFVLVPLNEIAPYVIHPVFGVSVKGLLSRLSSTEAVEVLSP